jgi:hypothetical protein
VASISITLVPPSLTVGQNAQANVLLLDSAGDTLTGRTLVWSTSNDAVARVSGSGVVAALAVGTTEVLVTSDGVTGSAPLAVSADSPTSTVPGLLDLNCPLTTAPEPPTAPLRTFYVDASEGKDENAGTSSAPWRTLDKANSAVRAGDRVYLKGAFSNQWIHPDASGTPTSKIVFQRWPGATALLDGGRDGGAIYFANTHHIVVDGLEIRNASYAISLADGSSFNWLRNLYVHDIDVTWLDHASDNRIEDSRFERCGSETTNSGDCMWIANGSSRNVIARNVMRFGGHNLVDVGGDKIGMAYADDNVVTQNDLANAWANNLGLIGFARRTIVECNLLHDATSATTVNYARAGLNVAASDNIVRYNLIYGNRADGIQIQGYMYQGLLQNAAGNAFYNNTVYGNGGASVLITQQQTGVVSDNLIANNIFWNNNLAGATERGRYYDGSSYDVWIDLYAASVIWPAGSMNGNVIQNNVLGSTLAEAGKRWLIIVINPNNRMFTLAQAQSQLPGVVGNREVDPLLNSDFTLQTGSPGIDAGTVLFPGQKLAGSAPDLGARERR